MELTDCILPTVESGYIGWSANWSSNVCPRPTPAPRELRNYWVSFL